MTRHQAPRLQRRSSRGVALIAVLWLVSLLMVLAVGMLQAVRLHGQRAQRSFETIELRELADSAIRVELLQLSAPLSGNRVPALPKTASVDLLGSPVELTVENEAGRIDLNTADRELLIALFSANKFSDEDALAYADRIVDWRDTDDERAARGAERPEYQLTGRRDAPRNGPFQSVAELRRVLGLEELSDELLDAFTVYTHAREVRQDAAPQVVMRSMQWADRKHLAGRQWLNHDTTATANIVASDGFAGEVLRVRVCVNKTAQRVCRRAIARVTGNQQRPLQVFAWEDAAAQ